MNSKQVPTLTLPTADSLLDRPAALGRLAFGAFSDADPDRSVAGPRPLAFLTPEALDLDLDDPELRCFGDYELQQKIGQGGMGVVYRARQQSLDRDVALKLLAAGPWASTDFIERFKREAQSAARMQHPNIVPIFEIGSQDGLHFFSMRLVRGPSLAQVLHESGPMAPPAAAALVRTLAEALDYAHRLGVLHLDLKPGNVLIDEHGEPQVADFGLSRRLDQTVQNDSDEVSGTPSYMAPEQALARANRFSRSTDIYGLGAILYELLTGRPPFLAATARETLRRVIADRPEAMRTPAGPVPADLEAICMKCLAKEPAERYRTARELAEELARFVDGRAVLVRPLGNAERVARWARREPRVATFAALFATALIVGLLGTTTQWRRAESGADSLREMLWAQRLDGALRGLDERNPAVALPLLATNLAEKERAGAHAAAERDRARIGAALAAAPRLIGIHHFDARLVAVAIAPGGRSIALGSTEPIGAEVHAPVVRLVDAGTGAERWRRPLGGLSHFMKAQGEPPPDQLAFSADGRRLMVHYDGPAALPNPHGLDMVMLDAATGEPVLPPASAFPDFSDANYSPDGRFALLRNAAEEWQAFDVEHWKALGPRRKLGVSFMTFAPGGRCAATTEAQTLQFISVPDLQRTRDVAVAAAVRAWNFDPSGTLLAAGLANGQVVLVDCASGRVQPLSPTPAAEIKAVRFVADGSALVAVSQDGSLMQWLLPSGALRHRTIREDADVGGLAADGDGGVLAVIPRSSWASGQDSSVRLWRAPTVADPDAQPHWLGRITTGDLSHRQPLDIDGNSGLVAVATRKGTLSVWRVPIAARRVAPAPPLSTSSLEFDGRRLVAARGRHVWLTDATDGRALWPAVTLPHPVGFATLSAQGDLLVATAGRHLHRFRAADGAPLGTAIELPNSPQRLSVTPDGRFAVVGWLAYSDGHLNEVFAAFETVSGRAAGPMLSLPGPLLGFGVDGASGRLLTWRETAVSVFELPTLRPLYPPIDFSATPAVPERATQPLFGRQLTDVVASGNRIAAIRFETLEAGPSTADICSATLEDGAVLGCAAMPAAWISIAGDASLRSVVTSDGQLLHADGTLGSRRGAIAPWPAAVAMAADGSRFARFMPEGIELVDATSGERLAPVLPVELAPGDALAQLAFAPDGRRLLGRSLLGYWYVWDTPDETRDIAQLQAGLALLQRTEVVAPLAPALAATLRRDDPGPPRQQPPPAPDAARWIGGLPVSKRSPEAPAETVDLTDVYDVALPAPHVFRYHAGYSRLLHLDGVQRLLGVDYDVRGAIAIAANAAWAPRSATVRLAAPRHVAAVNVLVAARAQRRDEEAAPFVHATLIYGDGSRHTQTFDYRRDLAPKWQDGHDPLGKSGPPWTAWLTFPSLHFEWFAYPQTFSALRVHNPKPELALEAVEFEAEAVDWSQTWILAVTLEPASLSPGATP